MHKNLGKKTLEKQIKKNLGKTNKKKENLEKNK
jgi:hypothetical protein